MENIQFILKSITLILSIVIIIYFLKELIISLSKTNSKDEVWREHIGDKDFIKEMKKVYLNRQLESAQYSTFMQSSNENNWNNSIMVSNNIIEQIKLVDEEDIDIFKTIPFSFSCVWRCNLPQLHTVSICHNCREFTKNVEHRNKSELGVQ